MKTSPLVSVVVPARDAARFLPDTLRSVLAQGGVALEVIVVDDGSTDDTPAVLRRFSDRITVVSQANAGQSAARNAGVARAAGRFLVFVDADDLFFPGVLRSQLEVLQADPARTMVVCRSLFFTSSDAAGAPIRRGEWRLFREDLDAHLCHFNIAPPHAFMVRREAVERAGGFDPGLRACEDHDLWFRLAVAGPPPAVNPGGLVAYRRHPGGMSRDLDRQRRHDAIMHHRVAATLREVDFPAGGRLEGLLGCLAGCLLTASRLEAGRPGEAGELIGLARDVLDRLGRESPPPGRDPGTAGYFLLRLAATLPRLSGLDQGFSEAVRELRARLARCGGAGAGWRAAWGADPDALERLTARLVF